MMTVRRPPETPRAIGDDLLAATLRRHVDHALRCARATTGDIGGVVLETVSLRCDDCGEVVLEAVQRLLKRKGSAR
jgi:hypothetical protein